jgi:hypothetical protein
MEKPPDNAGNPALLQCSHRTTALKLVPLHSYERFQIANQIEPTNVLGLER